LIFKKLNFIIKIGTAFAYFAFEEHIFLKIKIMKKLVIVSIIALLTAGWSIARAQQFPEEYLGLPGDNLNLYAVMKLFQESETLEEFEKNLNDEKSRINNLDLNGDNMVDYLMVMDYPDGNIHTIVLRASLDRNETQDVAVFTVQRFRDGSVEIQLVGDEALYGKNYIIEPVYAENNGTPNPGYMGNGVPNKRVTVVRTTTYEVAAWPVVRYIYLPSYSPWRSSWYYGYYPTYWSPWRPFYWHAYYGYHSHWHHHYYSYYRPWHHYRVPHYRNVYYTSVRTYSPTVVVNINKGNYRNTYTRPDTRRDGERLYQRTHASSNSRNRNATISERARVSGATSVQRSNINASSASERRGSTDVSARSATRTGSEVRSDAVRRTPEAASVRSRTGNTVNRSGVDERKSATIPAQREGVSRSSRRETTTAPRQGSTPAAVRTAPSSSSVRTQAAPKSAEVAPRVSGTQKREGTRPAVRQNTPPRTYTPSSTRTTSPAARQSAPQRPSPSVSAPRSQPSPKSGSVRSENRQSRSAVSSAPRSSGSSSAPAESGSSSRTRSSRNSERR
jgi:hypothetical protein